MQSAEATGAGGLRVLHVAQSVAGGVASFLEEVCDFQSARYGHANVRFLVPAGSGGHLAAIEPAQLTSFAPVDRRAAALLRFARAANREIRRFRPDIVHLHSSFAGALVRLALPFSEARPRIVYCPHGWAFGMETSKARKRIYGAVERLLARRADAILVNSEDEYRLAMQFGLPRGKTKVVRNGIAWAPLPPREPSTGPLRLAFIGRFDRQKGLDLLLDTLSRFPLEHVQFEIVGASVVTQKRRPGRPHADNLKFHGWLPRARTLELLRSVDALVMPSRWDAAPIVAIEAMRAGLPVIASNRGGLPEIVGDRIGGYIFDLDDPDALGRQLVGLTRDELKRLGDGARRRWADHYVAERMNELTCSSYERLVHARFARGAHAGAGAAPERIAKSALEEGPGWA